MYDFKEHEKSRGHDTTKESRLPVLNHKEMEFYNLPDKEFKVGILRKLNKLQEHTETQFNKIGTTIQK